LPPVGKSDHNVILVRPNCVITERVTKKSVFKRRISSDFLSDIANGLSRVKWHDMCRLDDCYLQDDFFYSNLNSILDKCAPLEDNDRPWVSVF